MNIGDRVRVRSDVTYTRELIGMEGTIVARYVTGSADIAWDVLLDKYKVPLSFWAKHLDLCSPELPEDL